MVQELNGNKMNIKTIATLAISMIALAACDDDATIVSQNMTKAADNFEIDRRIIFYNGITADYILVIEGKCSITDQTTQLEVICRTGKSEYKKHFLGLSNNVTYFAEQLEPIKTSSYHYTVVFKPQTILPDIDIRGSLTDTPTIK